MVAQSVQAAVSATAARKPAGPQVRLGPDDSPTTHLQARLLRAARLTLGDRACVGVCGNGLRYLDGTPEVVAEAFAPSRGYLSARGETAERAVETLIHDLSLGRTGDVTWLAVANGA